MVEPITTAIALSSVAGSIAGIGENLRTSEYLEALGAAQAEFFLDQARANRIAAKRQKRKLEGRIETTAAASNIATDGSRLEAGLDVVFEKEFENNVRRAMLRTQARLAQARSGFGAGSAKLEAAAQPLRGANSIFQSIGSTPDVKDNDPNADVTGRIL